MFLFNNFQQFLWFFFALKCLLNDGLLTWNYLELYKNLIKRRFQTDADDEIQTLKDRRGNEFQYLADGMDLSSYYAYDNSSVI